MTAAARAPLAPFVVLTGITLAGAGATAPPASADSKKLRHDGSTFCGLSRYRAWSSSTYPAFTPKSPIMIECRPRMLRREYAAKGIARLMTRGQRVLRPKPAV